MNKINKELACLRRQQEEIYVSENHQKEQEGKDYGSKRKSSHKEENFGHGLKIVADNHFLAAIQADPLPKNF